MKRLYECSVFGDSRWYIDLKWHKIKYYDKNFLTLTFYLHARDEK